MIDPALALQTALHDRLIGTPAVTALVSPDHIRAGPTRPDRFPTIIIGEGNTIMHGRAAGSQFVAGVFIDLHMWTDAGFGPAKAIGAAVAHTLMEWPAAPAIALDDFRHTRTVWPRDPDINIGHGVLSVEAVVRWRIDGLPVFDPPPGIPAEPFPSLTKLFEKGLA